MLREIFAREQRFFLTGGAALAEFYLHHRETDDLDLFSPVPLDLAMAGRNVEAACVAAKATTETVNAFPDFRRLRATRGVESCVIDLVVDRAPALDLQKTSFGLIRVDTLREITANKFCTVFSRSEPRDLVDLMLLLRNVDDLRPAIRDAEAKDGGFNPADLANLLGEVIIPKTARLPGDVPVGDLEAFRQRLIRELHAIAFERAKGQ